MTVPTILSLFTITLVLLIKLVFNKLNLLLMSGIDLFTLIKILLGFAPSIITFALPMALLMGVIMGVSRLTMDNEIIAMRAHGINLFKLFIPGMIFTAFMCVVLFYISSTVAPQMLRESLQKILDLQSVLIESLKPGQFHEIDFTGKKDKSNNSLEEMVLYYRERDEAGLMKGLFIKIEQPYEPQWKRDYFNKIKENEARRNNGEEVPGITLREFYPDEPNEPAYHTVLTSAGLMRREPLELSSEPALPNIDYLSKSFQGSDYPGDRFNDNELWKYSYPNAALLMVFAESGRINTEMVGVDDSGQRGTFIELELKNGSIQHLSVDNGRPDYLTVNFKEASKRLSLDVSIDNILKVNTNRKLRAIMADPKTSSKVQRFARRELGERIAIAPAMFVFMMFAVPLAIRLRPTGRSWGIMLAIGLMMFYYLLMKSGVSVYERGHAHGLLLAYIPNAMFLTLGLVLWWRALRA